jgi:hypothetical protein
MTTKDPTYTDPLEAVYTKTIRLKNGRILIAADYGLKAFCFIPRDRNKKR